jgi:hypothetical protein
VALTWALQQVEVYEKVQAAAREVPMSLAVSEVGAEVVVVKGEKESSDEDGAVPAAVTVAVVPQAAQMSEAERAAADQAAKEAALAEVIAKARAGEPQVLRIRPNRLRPPNRKQHVEAASDNFFTRTLNCVRAILRI